MSIPRQSVTPTWIASLCILASLALSIGCKGQAPSTGQRGFCSDYFSVYDGKEVGYYETVIQAAGNGRGSSGHEKSFGWSASSGSISVGLDRIRA